MDICMNFSNNFITANNQDEPDILRIFDSDGEFIDYIDYDFWLREMPESFYDFLQLFIGNEDLDWEVAAASTAAHSRKLQTPSKIFSTA